jgi:hypothetical protein
MALGGKFGTLAHPPSTDPISAATALPDSANPSTGRQWEGRTRALEEGERNMPVPVYPIDIEEVLQKQSDASTLHEILSGIVHT